MLHRLSTVCWRGWPGLSMMDDCLFGVFLYTTVSKIVQLGASYLTDLPNKLVLCVAATGSNAAEPTKNSTLVTTDWLCCTH